LKSWTTTSPSDLLRCIRCAYYRPTKQKALSADVR
jgi:hypothetical protein